MQFVARICGVALEYWNKAWKMPRFAADEKEAKKKATVEVNAVTLKHCAICKKCKKYGKSEAVVSSHNTSDCRVNHNKRPVTNFVAAPVQKKQRFVRQCWYCKQSGHFMLSRDQNAIECPLLLAEYTRPKCHHPGCNGHDHIAQYHYQPQDRHKIEGSVINSCKNVVLNSTQSGKENKSSMVFAIEGLSEEEARERFENGELVLDQ